jgi:hypothetical protein
MKKILSISLAALMMLAAVSCKKDETSQNSFVLDGVSYAVTAEIGQHLLDFGSYELFFTLSNGNCFFITCNSSYDGKVIDLTKKTDPNNGSWSISGRIEEAQIQINGSGEYSTGRFESGTLQVKKGNEGEGTIDFSIILKGGKVISNSDNKEHTIEVKFNGPVKLVAGFE